MIEVGMEVGHTTLGAVCRMDGGMEAYRRAGSKLLS